MKPRVQHPAVKVRTDRPDRPWYFRYWADELQPDGTLKTFRRYCELGPSIGTDKITRKQAEVKRDKVLAPLKNMTVEEMVKDGLVQMEKFVERFKTAHVNAEAGGRFLLKKPTREKYVIRMIANGSMPTSGRWKISRANFIEMKPMAIPASVDNRAARGVRRRIGSATNAPKNSISPLPRQAINPISQENREASAGDIPSRTASR